MRISKYAEHRGDVLATIRDAQLRHGVPPSVRDLAGKFDVGVATMHAYLQRLAEEGMVEWSRGKHRSLRCTQMGFQEQS